MKNIIPLAVAGALVMWSQSHKQDQPAPTTALVERQPEAPRAMSIIVAPDSARYEPRWQPMYSPEDMNRLGFIHARNEYTIHVNP